MHIQVWRGLNKGDDRGDAMKDAYKDDEDAFEETYGYNPWITYEWDTIPEQKNLLWFLWFLCGFLDHWEAPCLTAAWRCWSKSWLQRLKAK